MTITAVQVRMHLNKNHRALLILFLLLDIDECAAENGGCDQHCHNTVGSYFCTCDSGWRLDPDRHTCNGKD